MEVATNVLLQAYAADLVPQFPFMDPFTKTWLGLGVAAIALFEFWSAMWIFGSTKKLPGKPLMLRLHRLGGYIFLFAFLWLMIVGLNMYERLSQAGNYHLNPRVTSHVVLAVITFVILLIKVSFIRFYRKFRNYVNLLGVLVTAGTVVVWAVAGLMFIFLMRGVQTGG